MSKQIPILHPITVLYDSSTMLVETVVPPASIGTPNENMEAVGGKDLEEVIAVLLGAGIKVPESKVDELLMFFNQDQRELIGIAVAQSGLIEGTEPQVSEPTETEPAPETPIEQEPLPEPVSKTYEIQIDDPDGAWSAWFNSLLPEGSNQFEFSSGKPRITTTKDESMLQPIVDKFKADYPDYADLTFTIVEA